MFYIAIQCSHMDLVLKSKVEAAGSKLFEISLKNS